MSRLYRLLEEIRDDESYSIPSGEASDVEYVAKFGSNQAILGTSETVWLGGGLYPWQTTDQALTVVSTSANDAAAGTGWQTFKVFYQDAAGNDYSETQTITGTTPVTLDNAGVFIYRIYGVDVGSGGVNAGTITGVYNGATTIAQVTAGEGQTLQAVYRIPVGKKAVLREWWVSADRKGNAAVNVELWTKKDGESWRIRRRRTIHSQGATTANFNLRYGIPLEALERVEVRADSSVNVGVDAGFDIKMVTA